MFSFLKKIFKKPEPRPRLTLPSHTQPISEDPAQTQTRARSQTAPAPAAATPVKQTRPEKPGPGSNPKAKEEWARQAAKRINPDATPEQLCGIAPGMTKEEIANQLATLYRRHNRAASSLEPRLRDEAEIMLDVIAALRQKYGG
jgi:hypothetical protein